MTPINFCYWLQGKLELDGEPSALTVEQVRMIANHLNLVFIHSIDDDDPTGEKQATHDGKKVISESGAKEIEKQRPTKWPNRPPARC